MTFKEERRKQKESGFLIQELVSDWDSLIKAYPYVAKFDGNFTSKDEEIFNELPDICDKLIELIGKFKAQVPKK